MSGGYKTPFDPRPLLKRLEIESDKSTVWEELWNELHHQGDVGEASFAAVPYLVRAYRQRGVIDWNTFAIVAVIELARKEGKNPDVPGWLEEDYFRAIRELAELAATDGVSLNQFIAAAVAEKVGSLRAADDFLRERAGTAKPKDMLKYLRRAPKVVPNTDDMP